MSQLYPASVAASLRPGVGRAAAAVTGAFPKRDLTAAAVPPSTRKLRRKMEESHIPTRNRPEAAALTSNQPNHRIPSSKTQTPKSLKPEPLHFSFGSSMTAESWTEDHGGPGDAAVSPLPEDEEVVRAHRDQEFGLWGSGV